MAQTSVEDLAIKANLFRDSAPTASRTVFIDSIVSGDGDGSSAGFHAFIGNPPTESRSGFQKESMVSTIAELADPRPIQCRMVDRTWKTRHNLQEREPWTDMARENQHLRTWNLHSSYSDLDNLSSRKLSPKAHAEIDTHFTGACKSGVQDTGDILNTKTYPEVIKEGQKKALTVSEPADREEADVVKDANREADERGMLGRWDRSTVLALALFVGLRLSYEVWFGNLDIFNDGVNENDVDL